MMVQGPSGDLRWRGGRGGRRYRDRALREHPVHQLADGALEAPPAQGARGLSQDRMEVGANLVWCSFSGRLRLNCRVENVWSDDTGLKGAVAEFSILQTVSS